MLAALLCGATGFTIFGLAPAGDILWLGIPVMALWGLLGPSAQSLMTRRVSPAEQGQLQGAIHGLRGVSGLIGPGLFTLTFAFAIGSGHTWQLPGTPFLLAAALLTGAMLLAWRITRLQPA